MTEKRRLEVLEYNDDWPVLFEAEANRLRDVFGAATVQIYHVGSTSVPGLKAKPTIDILIELETGTDIPSFDSEMQSIGYICRGECLDAPIPGTPGRYYFVRKEGLVHLVHVHACVTGHHDINEKLCFRDYLRDHSNVALKYGNLKQQLARQLEFDNLGYMLRKDAFVKEVIANALEYCRTVNDT